ncbi:MAG: hypothetical protein RMJ33_10620 [Saprospiraceae bacterium]|nr:hypothetical protein [Saprospiraceae bacterium]MDW8230280.1 hypothetical protein [Saprospiraceae bacterium]
MDRNTWIGLAIAAFAVAFVFSFPKNTAVEDLEAQTMAIHDKAMAEMAEMNRLGRALKRLKAELPDQSPRADSLQLILYQMKKAEDDMYTWMRQYNPPPKGHPQEEALQYLEEQKRLISQNQQDIRAACDAARQILQQQ